MPPLINWLRAYPIRQVVQPLGSIAFCDKLKAWSQCSWLEKSTLTWLYKLRRAMVSSDWDQLTGAIEVEETYIGGVGAKVGGRGAKRKTIVAIAAKVRGRGPGRIRMSVIIDVSAISLHEFVSNNGKKDRKSVLNEFKPVEGRNHFEGRSYMGGEVS